MTVAELRDILDNLPDDATLLVREWKGGDFPEQEAIVDSITHEHTYSGDGEENDSNFVYVNF